MKRQASLGAGLAVNAKSAVVATSVAPPINGSKTPRAQQQAMGGSLGRNSSLPIIASWYVEG